MQATARIFILKAPAKRTTDNLCPVKLCITHNNKRQYYSIKEKITKHDWQFIAECDIDKVFTDSPRGKYKDQRFEYNRIVSLAEKCINDIPFFSFGQFEEKFFNKVADWANFFESSWNHAKDLRSEGRIGYASSFECMIRAVKEYHEGKEFKFKRADKVATREAVYLKGKPLRFVDISPKWLKGFEKWMQEKEMSRSTQGIYVRNIRVLFNLAIKKHPQLPYPFSEHKPKKAKGRKLALTAEQINLIANYQTEHPMEQLYRDMFMFSFLANGMNIADIIRLKYSNIHQDEIIFVRKKTELEETEEEAIRVPITRMTQAIIDRHGNRAIGHDAFLFPFIKNEWSAEKCYNYTKAFIKTMNQYIKGIARAVGIKEKISSYTARHSFATISKNSGASVEFISEALGHSSVNITKAYLKGFEGDARRKHASMIEKLINNEAV